MATSTSTSSAHAEPLLALSPRDNALEEAVGVRQAFKNLFFFATPRDITMVWLSAICFFATGVLSAAMNIIMGNGFSPPDTLDATPHYADAGRDIFLKLCVLGAVLCVTMMGGVFLAMFPKHRQLTKWKIAYVKAILRQDIGWCARPAAAMPRPPARPAGPRAPQARPPPPPTNDDRPPQVRCQQAAGAGGAHR